MPADNKEALAVPSTETGAETAAAAAAAAKTGSAETNGRTRMISQSMGSGSTSTPTVAFADNRHIIPRTFLERRPQLVDHVRSRSENATPTQNVHSWGATTVNRKLRYEVFGEAFLQQPVPVQPHKKPGYHRTLTHRSHNPQLRATQSEFKPDGSEVDFQETAGTSAPEKDIPSETPRRKRRFSSGGLRRKPDRKTSWRERVF